jgi:hypothetical protein
MIGKAMRSRLSVHSAQAQEVTLTPEIQSEIETEIALWMAERVWGSKLDEQRWAYSVADEGEFKNLLNRVKSNSRVRNSDIDEFEIWIAVSVICLRPDAENTSPLDVTHKILAAIKEICNIVNAISAGNRFATQPLLYRDLVIAWGNGWHRLKSANDNSEWGGRWNKCALALLELMERAVERTSRLLSETVDQMFSTRTTDPDSPGNKSTISGNASILTFAAITDSCECGSNKCYTKHRLSSWAPLLPNGRAFPLRAFAAQMSRGDAGPKFLNKEFQNSAYYPIVRNDYGLLYHEKVEFKLCHVCRSKYEAKKCRCGTADDPLLTKHFVFENAFWVKDHKAYVKRRRQLCRGCENLYDIKLFKRCPLCGEERTPNRDTKVHVLERRLNNQAVIYPDYTETDLEQEESSGTFGDHDISTTDIGQSISSESDIVRSPEGMPNVIDRLVVEGERSMMLTGAEAHEIRERIKIGDVDMRDVRRLAVRILLGKLHAEATQSNDLFRDEIDKLEDCIFDKNRTVEEMEKLVIIIGAKLIAKRGIAAGVMTPHMEEQLIALSIDSGSLEDALESRTGLANVVRTATLVIEARNTRVVSEIHARQCLREAFGHTTLEALEDNAERIRAYILSGLGRRIGTLEEHEAWAIRDEADNGIITQSALVALEEQIRDMLKPKIPL